MRAKNINGASDSSTCPCGSWIRHWENYSGISRWLCAVSGCEEKATEGAHVQLKDAGGNHRYIVPMCKTHNGKHGQELGIQGSARPIPVTARGRCRP